MHAALPEWRAEQGRFDAIVTHFFLDCFPPEKLAAVTAELSAAACPSASWLVADFTVPSRGLARHREQAVHVLMYALFRRVGKVQARCVTDPAPLLAARGFALRGRKMCDWGLLHSDCWVR